jgi:protein MpaA
VRAKIPHSSLRGTVVIVPGINPDGLERRTRKNANGIDINRNFPTRHFGASGENSDPDGRYFGGETPGSEPETRAVLETVGRVSPNPVVTLHAPLTCVNYDGPAEQDARALAEVSALPLEAEIGYPTPGSLGTSLGKERGIRAITLELGADNDMPPLIEALLTLVVG